MIAEIRKKNNLLPPPHLTPLDIWQNNGFQLLKYSKSIILLTDFEDSNYSRFIDKMYAVINEKGKQYKVSENQELLVDRMKAPAGDLIEFNSVLMISGEGVDRKVGRPELDGARVLAEVVGHERGPKIHTVRFKGPSQTTIGHRQDYTRVKIREIHPDWGVENGA